MGQQFFVIRNMPTPGSEAALAREARVAKRNQRRGITIVEDEPEPAPEAPKTTQRAQPVNPKNRKKKKR
jgi:YidC/Oxa1 family membrane protein insertase